MTVREKMQKRLTSLENQFACLVTKRRFELDMEHLVVIGTGFGDDMVTRVRPEAGLHELLEQALVVGQALVLENGASVAEDMPAGKAARFIEAGVQEDGADDRLESVGEDGRAAAASGFALGLAQQNELAKPHPLRALRQHLARDE